MNRSFVVRATYEYTHEGNIKADQQKGMHRCPARARVKHLIIARTTALG